MQAAAPAGRLQEMQGWSRGWGGRASDGDGKVSRTQTLPPSDAGTHLTCFLNRVRMLPNEE